MKIQRINNNDLIVTIGYSLLTGYGNIEYMDCYLSDCNLDDDELIDYINKWLRTQINTKFELTLIEIIDYTDGSRYLVYGE